jgi:hypothetical protein
MSKQRRLENNQYVFLPRHINDLIGLSERQLRYWKDTGFFVPMKVRQHLRYSFVDFCLLTCVKNMRSHGISVQKMRKDQVPKLMSRYRKAIDADFKVKALSFALINKDPVIFTGRIFMSEDNGITTPVVFSQLWEAVREIRVQTRLDTLESTAL